MAKKAKESNKNVRKIIGTNTDAKRHCFVFLMEVQRENNIR